jgi:putative ATP-binding cassette transporter
MKFILHLLRTTKRGVLLVAALGILGGFAGAGLVAVINHALHDAPGRRLWIMAFLALVVVKVGCSLVSNLLLVRMAQKTILDLCDDLCRRITATPLRQLEQIGAPRILACLIDDVAVLGAAIQVIPSLTVNVAVLAGCAVYLGLLSWIALLAMLVLVAAGALCYKILLTRAYRAIQLARDGRDVLFRQFRSLIEGIKELKLSRERREMFLRDEIGGTADYLRHQNVISMNQYTLADGWSQSMFYLLLALLLFALPAMGRISLQTLTAYVFTALYTMTPIWSLIGALPMLNRGRDALERLEKFGLGLQASDSECCASPPKPPVTARLQFRDALFSYEGDQHASGFTLGPLNLDISPGEIVFVVGGNGSGKSTFVKLLTGLYLPQDGEIRVNGELITTQDQAQYRQLFAVVYSDFYLFERLLGFRETEIDAKAAEYLDALELSHKVRIEGSRFSTTALSQGQRRRLALLAAYLEDRPVYVLDEWAADQDPAFRQVFYTRLLPELKKRGKAVVVVTHDDRYYHLGDRILKLDYGRVVETRMSVGDRL